jgi:hypothetical protein
MDHTRKRKAGRTTDSERVRITISAGLGAGTVAFKVQ